MILKIVSLFLIVMLVLGMFGKLRLPRIGRPRDQGRLGRPGKCPRCGKFLLGGAKCTCSGRG
nr:hypothetical protein [Alkalilacustris brevis]